MPDKFICTGEYFSQEGGAQPETVFKHCHRMHVVSLCLQLHQVFKFAEFFFGQLLTP